MVWNSKNCEGPRQSPLEQNGMDEPATELVVVAVRPLSQGKNVEIIDTSMFAYLHRWRSISHLSH
jgi:hypothetical protein